jgi:hypothetical protein
VCVCARVSEGRFLTENNKTQVLCGQTWYKLYINYLFSLKRYTYVTSYGELTTVSWLSAGGWSDTVIIIIGLWLAWR